MAGQRSRVLDAARPAVEAAGLDLEDVEITPAGRRSVVRVIVDSDAGVDLDTVADVSRAVGAALDAADALGETPYVLEVTSPGVDRPLREPRHWRRATGRLVATTVGGEPVTGRVVAADDTGVTIEVRGEQRRAAYGELGDGAVQIEFNPPKREGASA
jgi:ribosome maturation factor RimP